MSISINHYFFSCLPLVGPFKSLIDHARAKKGLYEHYRNDYAIIGALNSIRDEKKPQAIQIAHKTLSKIELYKTSLIESIQSQAISSLLSLALIISSFACRILTLTPAIFIAFIPIILSSCHLASHLNPIEPPSLTSKS